MGTGISVNEKHIKRPHIGDTTMYYGHVYHATGISAFGTLTLKPEGGLISKDLDRNQISLKSDDAAFIPTQIVRGKSGLPQSGRIPEMKRLDAEHAFYDRSHMAEGESE